MAVATKVEHPLYEVVRSLEASVNPIAALLRDELVSVQHLFYSEVNRQIAGRLRSSSQKT
ncbi:hypothetical protein [Salana multivorans]